MQREAVIRQKAEEDGTRVHVVVEQEPGGSGKESAEATVRGLAGWSVHVDRPHDSKMERAQPLSAQAEVGNVKLLRAAWNADFLAHAHRFTGAGSKGLIDLIDAAAGGFNWLARRVAASGGAVVPVLGGFGAANEGLVNPPAPWSGG